MIPATFYMLLLTQADVSTFNAEPDLGLVANSFDLSAFIITPLIWLTVIISLVVLVVVLVWIYRFSKRKKDALDLVFLNIIPPRNNEIKIEAAEQMFASLYSLYQDHPTSVIHGQPHMSIEMVAKDGQVRFYVAVPSAQKEAVLKHIHSSYSDCEVRQLNPPNLFEGGGQVAIAELGLKSKGYFPIKRYKELENVDSLNNLANALGQIDDNETACIQIVFSPKANTWQTEGSRAAGTKEEPKNPETPKDPNPVGDLMKAPQTTEDTAKKINEKIGKVGFATSIRVMANATTKIKAENYLNGLVGAFSQFTDPMANGFKKRRFPWNLSKKTSLRYFVYRIMPLVFGRMTLTSEELATIFHLPNKNVTSPRLFWLESRHSSAPLTLPETGLYLGKSLFRGEEKKVNILPDDRRRHMYIIGQTGVGKSELLKFMAYQDIAAGNGLCFIDPHGSAVQDLLRQVPENRIEDVIYFNAADLTRPIGLNILEAETEEQKHIIINAFIALLYKLYDPERRGIMGPMLERTVRNVMLTAMVDPEATMVEVLRLVIDPTFSQKMLPRITDPLVKRYWTDEMANTMATHKSEKMGYFVSKFDRFVTEKLMRNIIGQSKSSFNLGEVMNSKKILLVDLSKGSIGEENSNFLGLLLVPRILATAMTRLKIPEAQRNDFYLYVDEFQNFATPDFATILSEARKYKLDLIVANQFIAQIKEDIRNAVFGNIGTLVSFRVGTDDAEYLEKQFDPVFKKTDLINIPVGSSYMRLLVKGAPTVPFSMSTDWNQIQALPKNEETAKKIIELSRLKYGRDAALVEKEINDRLTMGDLPAPQGAPPPSAGSPPKLI